MADKLQKKFPNRFEFYQIRFSQLDVIFKDNVDAVIFDLGLSSIQLDDLDEVFLLNLKKSLI